MRARASEIAGDQATTITFDGQPIPARHGETVAAALAAAAISVFRTTRAGAPRGLFCGMGVCQDCLVQIDGRPNQRACMTKVAGPLAVRTQRFPPALDDWPAAAIEGGIEPKVLTPDVLVVGAGAGGLTAAAVAAEAGAAVLLVDERPAPGGQYFKQPSTPFAEADDRQFAAGRGLIERAGAAGVTMVQGVVWAAFAPLEISVHGSSGNLTVRPRQLIVATGAFERGLPVPGWTLPGVMTTGAAQTLLRSYRVLPGRRIVVAGNGPLNLQVACELHRARAEVVAVAELAPVPGAAMLGTLGRMALSAPRLVAQGLGYRRELRRAGIPLLDGHVLGSVERREGGLLAHLRPNTGADEATYAADVVTMGYGFLPANEILRLLGCGHEYDAGRGHLVTVRDADGRTTVPAVFGIGDACGLGGARAAEAEGVIAGLAAAEAVERLPTRAMLQARRQARRELARQRRFQAALWRLFRGPSLGLALADATTVVCRCEEVTLGNLELALADGVAELGTLKRRTRAGMGRCQGRYCGPLLAGMLQARTGTDPGELGFFAPRPPIRPVALDVIGVIGEHGREEAETCRSS